MAQKPVRTRPKLSGLMASPLAILEWPGSGLVVLVAALFLGPSWFRHGSRRLGFVSLMLTFWLGMYMVIFAFLRRASGVTSSHFRRAAFVSFLLAASAVLLVMHTFELYVSPADVTGESHGAGAARPAGIGAALPEGREGIPPWRLVLDGTHLHAVRTRSAHGEAVQVKYWPTSTRLIPLLKPRDIFWCHFCSKVSEQASKGEPSPGRRIWEFSRGTEAWESIVIAAGGVELTTPRQRQVVKALNDVLKDPQFYQKQYFEGVPIEGEAQELLSCDRDALSTADIVRLNRSLLKAAYPKGISGFASRTPEREMSWEGGDRAVGLRVDVATIERSTAGRSRSAGGGDFSPRRLAEAAKVTRVRWRSRRPYPSSSLSSLGLILNWRPFCSKLNRQRIAGNPSPGRRIWELLPPEARSAVEDAAQGISLDEERKIAVVEALDRILKNPHFYRAGDFPFDLATAEAIDLLMEKPGRLSPREAKTVNLLLLDAAYANEAAGTKVVCVRWRSREHSPSSLSSLGVILNWSRFCSKLKRQRTEETPSLGKRIWALLPPESRSAVEDAARGAKLGEQSKITVVTALEEILRNRGFYRIGDLPFDLIPPKAMDLLGEDRERLSAKEVETLNVLILKAAYPQGVLEGHRFTWEKRCQMSPDNGETWIGVPPGRYRLRCIPKLIPLGIDDLGTPVDKLIIDGATPYVYAIFSPIVPLAVSLALCFGAAWREWFRKYVAEALIVNVIAAVPAIVWLVAAASVLDVRDRSYVWKIMIVIGLLFVPQAYELLFAVLVRYQRTGRFVSDFCRGFTITRIFWGQIFGRLVLWARLLRIWAGAAGFAVLMDVTLNYLNSFSSPPTSSPTWGRLIQISGGRLCNSDLAQQNVLVFAGTAGAIVLLILTFYCLSDFILSCERKLDV